MRAPVLICCLALALAACGSKKTANQSAVAEENAATETIVTNDVTAIDAATGEAANMAADVNYTFDESNLASDNETNAATAKPARKTPKPASKPAAPATGNSSATSNAAAEATTNNTM